MINKNHLPILILWCILIVFRVTECAIEPVNENNETVPELLTELLLGAEQYSKSFLVLGELNHCPDFPMNHNVPVSYLTIATNATNKFLTNLNHIENQLFLCYGNISDAFALIDNEFVKQHKARFMPINIFIKEPILDPTNLIEIFKLAWEERQLLFVNLLVTIDDTLTALTANPFKEYEIYQRETDEFPLVLPPITLLNFNTKPIKTPLIQDPPKVYKYHRNNVSGFSGYDGQLLKVIAAKMNATIQEFNIGVNYLDFDRIQTLLNNYSIDFAMHSYPAHINRGYPSKHNIYTTYSVYVPVAHQIPPFQNIIWPFTSSTWLAILIILLLYPWILQLFSRNSRKSIGIIEALFKLIQVITNGGSQLINNSNAVRILLVIFYFFSIVINSHYSATLFSFLTQSVYEPEINSFAELVKRKIPICATALDFEIILKYDLPFLTADVQKLFYPVETPVLYKWRNDFNTSNAYLTASDRNDYFIDKQGYLGRKYYHFSEEYVYPMIVTYLFPPASPYYEHVNDIILRIVESGIWNDWRKNSYMEAVINGIELMVQYIPGRKYEEIVLNLEHFLISFVLLTIGSFISIAVFVFEYFKGT